MQGHEVRASVDVEGPSRDGPGRAAEGIRRAHGAVEPAYFGDDPLDAPLQLRDASLAAAPLRGGEQRRAVGKQRVEPSRGHRTSWRPDRLKRSLHVVVLFLRDRIELVVVAAGAIYRQTEKCLGHGSEHLLEEVFADLRPFLGDGGGQAHGVDGAERQHGRGDDAVRSHRFDHVARQLLAGEEEIRFIGVEAADDVVAVGPGVIAREVALEALAFREPDQVEPMARPALAVVWRSQQAVQQFFVGARRRVLDERLHVPGIRRQSQQGEAQAADQGAAIGLRSGPQSGAVQAGEDPAVDRRGQPRARRGPRGRRLGLAQGLEGPPVPPGAPSRDPVGPHGAAGDPAPERLLVGTRKRRAGGHLVGQHANQHQAVRRIRRRQSRSPRAAAQRRAASRQIQPAHGSLRTVARQTAALQDRRVLDVGLGGSSGGNQREAPERGALQDRPQHVSPPIAVRRGQSPTPGSLGGRRKSPPAVDAKPRPDPPRRVRPTDRRRRSHARADACPKLRSWFVGICGKPTQTPHGEV